MLYDLVPNTSIFVPGHNPSEAKLPRSDYQVLGAAGLRTQDPHGRTQASGSVRAAQSCQGSRWVHPRFVISAWVK